MADGWQALGDVLGGGVEAARVNAFQQGQYRRAQTEDALAAARKGQAEAMKAERQNMDAQWLIDHAGELNYTDPSSALLSRVISGGMGGDFSSALTGTKTGQDIRFRDTAADPTVGAEQRTRVLGALHGQPYADLVPVGSSGYTDITSDDPTVTATPRTQGGFGVSAARQNYEEWVAAGGQPSPEAFQWFVRNAQITQAGGVPYDVQRTPGSTPRATPLVSQQETAANAGAVRGAQTLAGAQSKVAAALPGTLEALDDLDNTIDQLLSAPGFQQIYGVSGSIDPAQLIPGSDYSNAKALRDSVSSKTFTNAIQKMRGLGQLSNMEGDKLQQAFTRATNPNLSDEEAELAWNEVKVRTQRLRRVAEQEAGQQPANTQLPPTNTQGWQLMEDANGNKAYVGPNGEVQEVQ